MKNLLVASLVVALLPLAASAAMVTYTVEYAGSYDNDTDWNPIGDKSALFEIGAIGYDANWVHELQIKAAVSGLTAEEDLHRLGIAIDLDGTTVATFGGWAGSRIRIELRRAACPSRTRRWTFLRGCFSRICWASRNTASSLKMT